MPRPKDKPSENDREREVGSVRLSVSLLPEQYEYLERVAKRQRVSLAWVVRDAILRYMDAEAPLFAQQD